MTPWRSKKKKKKFLRPIFGSKNFAKPEKYLEPLDLTATVGQSCVWVSVCVCVCVWKWASKNDVVVACRWSLHEKTQHKTTYLSVASSISLSLATSAGRKSPKRVAHLSPTCSSTRRPAPSTSGHYTHTHSFDRTWSWRRFRPCFLSRMWSLWMPSLPWSHHPSKRQRREMGKNIYPSLLDIKDGGDICVYLSCDCKKAKSIDQPPEWGDLPEFCCCCCLPRSQIRSSWLGD